MADLPQLQSQWFARPIIKYQQWRAQELINWIRTAKIIIRTNRIKKKDLKANSKKIEVYTVLDDTTEANLPMYSKNRIHKIHRISKKEELDRLSNPLISAYFPTRGNLESSEQTE